MENSKAQAEKYYQLFLDIDKKYIFEANNKKTRQNIINEYYSLFDKNFIGRFVDYTTIEQENYGIVNIRVETEDYSHSHSIKEFCDKYMHL